MSTKEAKSCWLDIGSEEKSIFSKDVIIFNNDDVLEVVIFLAILSSISTCNSG